jgi:hypothetical protein
MEHLESPTMDLEDRVLDAGGQVLKPSFSGAVLVCGDCEERSSGPEKLRSKDVRKCMKEAVRPAKGRVRVAVTGCLGPCPKRAMTVAVVAGAEVHMFAVDRGRQLDPVAALAVEAVSRGPTDPRAEPEG